MIRSGLGSSLPAELLFALRPNAYGLVSLGCSLAWNLLFGGRSLPPEFSLDEQPFCYCVFHICVFSLSIFGSC